MAWRRSISQKLHEKAWELRQQPDNLFIYLVATFSTAVTATEVRKIAGTWVVLAALAAATAIYLWLLTRRKMPEIDPVSIDRDFEYLIEVPPRGEDVRYIIRQSKAMFGPAAIDSEADFLSFRKDPFSAVILKNSEGNIRGFLDIYCFSAEDFDAYMEGRISSHELFSIRVLAHPAARSAPVIYIPTIVNYSYLLQGTEFWRSRENALMVWGMTKLLLDEQCVPPGGIDLYAAAWSKSGEQLLRHYGFEPAGKQEDGGSLYRRKGTSRQDLLDVRARFEPLSRRLCQFTRRDF